MSLPTGIWEPLQIKRFTNSLYPDILLQTRLTVRRNLASEHFASQLEPAERQAISKSLITKISKSPGWDAEAFCIDPSGLSPYEAAYLLERQWCDASFIQSQGGFLFVSQDRRVALSLGGDDHIRWTANGQGVCFQALLAAFEADAQWRTELEFAFHPKFGHLTNDVVEAGGIKFSTVLHVPALLLTDQYASLSAELHSEGLRLSGLFGAVPPAPGALLVLSHRFAAGYHAEELAKLIETASIKIARRERACRRAALRESRLQLEDMIARGYGILKHARTISLEEIIVLHSSLRVGVDFGWIQGIPMATLDALVERVGPAYLPYRYGVSYPAKSIDELRAIMVHEALQNSRLTLDDETRLSGE